ncbi:MAG: LamG-like jellyroll fold domain-containing protein [Chitinophagaceae bacterium]
MTCQSRISSISNIEPNVWTHVAASFYDSTMYIFINGKLETSLPTADRFINVFYSAPDGAGVFPDFSLAGLGSKLGYNGEMDELRLWGKRRNADSIKATMNTIVDPRSTGLGLYYRFDGDVSARARDIASSNRNAVFIKPATSVDSSGAPINFTSYQWMPGGATTKSIVANPTSNTIYTVTVTDYKGTSGSNTLLVYPAQGPTITAPAAVARTNSPSSCTVFISDADLGNATALDNCPGVKVQITGVPAGNIFPVGVTTITHTATNAGGLVKTATQTVTVTDNQKPVITSNGNQAVNNNKDVCGAAVNVSATATDNCSVGAPTGVRSDGLALAAIYPVGTTTITWNVADANGNAALPVTQTVIVTDNQKPVITSSGNKVVNNDKDVCGAAVNVSATATDNCSVGAPTGSRSDGLAMAAIYPVGTTTITWNVADANSNAALPVTQTVTVKDNQKPVITSNGNKAVNNNIDICGAAVTVSATATDNCSVGAPTGIRSDGLALAAIYPVGTTTITWKVADAYGNVAIPVTQTVTVTDNQKPTVLTKNIIVTLVNGTASITVSQIDAGSKDNCGIRSMSISPSTFICGNYGDNTVTLTVVDIYGNVGSKTATVTVKGVAPAPSISVSRTDNTFTGLDGKTIAIGYGAQQLILTASNTTSASNATTYKWSPTIGLSSTNTATTVFKPAAAGTFVFTVTATNEFGCTASTTVTITVVDVRCGNKNDKVLVCHGTGSTNNPTTQLCISPNAVAEHLSKGDYLGICTVTTTSANMEITTPTTSAKEEIKGIETELRASVTPNPTNNVFRLRITSNDQNTPATVRVLDAFGRSLNQFDKVAIGSTITFGQGYIHGFYFVEVLQGKERVVLKLVKQPN